MKKVLFLLLFVSGLAFANNNNPVNSQDTPQIGDELIINAVSNIKYNHVNFPKLNFIVKRGGLATYKTVHGNEVVIKEVNAENGKTTVVLEKKDGSKFFGYLTSVEADYEASLNSGELSVKN
ncbi:hypothetical protein [Gaetbulibacter saemankumensis]|uniref:hypothetical protein n=1 Tax=Gaetbulibacter saemankumensis TaxID=311208 RepID=UPI00040B2CC4|nr:hypothetical protein [Gaetbulibacter saemankumensis]